MTMTMTITMAKTITNKLDTIQTNRTKLPNSGGNSAILDGWTKGGQRSRGARGQEIMQGESRRARRQEALYAGGS